MYVVNKTGIRHLSNLQFIITRSVLTIKHLLVEFCTPNKHHVCFALAVISEIVKKRRNIVGTVIFVILMITM